MKITANFLISLLAINLMSCGTSPVMQKPERETDIVKPAKYPDAEIKHNISKCTSFLRKSIETHFIEESGLGTCNTSLFGLTDYLIKNSHRNTQLVNETKRYQNIFSEIYRNRKLFNESNMYVQNIKRASFKIKLHIDNLSKIFLNFSGNTAKDFAYVNGRNEVLFDRIILNVELAINPGTSIDERVKKLDRMAKDTIIFGKILYGMLYGDDKLRIQKVKNEQARNELKITQNIYKTIRKNVGALLDEAPDLFKLWYKFRDLQSINDRLVGA